MTQTPEARLAYLGFQLIPPRPLLRPYVRSYWYFRRESPLSTYHEEFMHPTGGFGIVFNFGDQLRLDAQPLAAPVFLDGTNTVSRRLGFLGHIELMGIRFHEGGAFPFFGIPLIEFQDELNVLEGLKNAALLRLHSRLYEAKSLSARLDLVESWLIERLSLGITRSALIPESLSRLRAAVTALRQGYRRASISELTEELAISQRQLEHLYRGQVGMTPMHYMRLQRVEIARLALAQEKQSNIRLAADLGYYDQAHFIHEFRSVIGITPYAYRLRKQSALTSTEREAVLIPTSPLR